MYEITDITPFERAIHRLEEGLERYQKYTSDVQNRDGVIQRFKFTYELGCRILKRYLKYTAANPALLDQMTLQSQIRTANEQGLLFGPWPGWRDYRKMRDITSHTNSEAIAVTVIAAIPGFLEEVVYLRDRLQGWLE